MTPQKPTRIEEWLCSVNVGGLIVESRMTGCDTSETFWKLIPTDAFGNTDGCAKPEKFPDSSLRNLVDLRPDHCSVLRPRREIVAKVEAWKKFEKSESRDLAEYNRLRLKFEGKGG